MTIDGPSGSGKGTLSRLLANEKSWHLLDSGSLYRALVLLAKNRQVDFSDEQALAILIDQLDIEFETQTELIRVFLKNNEVTDDIRSEEVGRLASKVAAFPQVRQKLLACQRAFKRAPGLVADGRDMGTVVFPEAQLKVFLTASIHQRTVRRHHQLLEKGINVSLAELQCGIEIRDKRDEERPISPSKPAENAIIIDTSALRIDEVLNQLMVAIEQKIGLVSE